MGTMQTVGSGQTITDGTNESPRTDLFGNKATWHDDRPGRVDRSGGSRDRERERGGLGVPAVQGWEPLPALDAAGRSDTDRPEQVRPESVVTIEDCRWAIADYQSALPRARAPLGKRVDEMLSAAIGARFLIEQSLIADWDNDDREDDVIANLGEYVAWTDAIHDLCRCIGKSGSRCL